MNKDLYDHISQYISLTEEEMNEMEALDVIKHFKKDTVLLRAGEISNKSYFVLKGCLRVYYLIDGEEKTTAFYTEKQGITPQTYITNKPSEYSLVCVEDCSLTVGTREMEQDFLKKFPRFETLCRIIAEQQLSDNQLTFDRYMLSTPEQRYQHLLETNPALLNRVPQYQLASYIGVKPESLSRIRKQMAQK